MWCWIAGFSTITKRPCRQREAVRPPETSTPVAALHPTIDLKKNESEMNIQTAIAVLVVTIGSSISTYADEGQPAETRKQTEIDGYVPGMGEIMGLTQMRHSKLWFAGNARNWDLAKYELDEIREGLDDAIKYHPVFKKDAPIAAILDKFTAKPLNDLGSAIETKDSAQFNKSFDNLTKACNECHEAASQGFIVIKRPGVLQYTNQEFAVTTK